MWKQDKLTGLTSEQARERLQKFGRNEPVLQRRQSFALKLIKTVCEPMFLLLIAAAVIYFILGEPRDGAIMLIFVVAIIAIDAIQEYKTDKTLSALKNLSAPHATVIRDGREVNIPSAEIVPGDIMLVCEGEKIPADGEIIKCSDLSVDESTLTGESVEVRKRPCEGQKPQSDHWRVDCCYAGTLCTRGSAAVRVTRTGEYTEYGKISRDVAGAPDMPTPLQKQTNRLVKICAFIAGILFLLVVIITFFNIAAPSLADRLIRSVLSGITLAMAMIPEEFPVVLTVFLSMGAWRLAGKKSLVRTMPSVETLGAVSVLCVDKTGTVTMNEMTVKELIPYECDEKELLRVMGTACETNAYDPMERAMLNKCEAEGIAREELFSGDLIKEYSFTDRLKMMGHVRKRADGILIAAKGSPEKILSICDMSEAEGKRARDIAESLSESGLRVIAVAGAKLGLTDYVPDALEGCKLELKGLVGLYDPPRENVRKDIEICRRAGIRVIMITGDHGATAGSIAREVGISECGSVITGDMLDKLSDEELCMAVKTANIFARVIPEHKMRIVKALRQNGEVVAMTGDGVNDAPALKYADIGIAMGKRGSEVSREAADLILLDDNFSTIVDTVKDGRRIFDNIRKAVGYIFTIHIPIALASLLAPLLGLSGDMLMLLPLHVVLLELLIDPTCSIVLERQPAEDDIMRRPPRSGKEGIIGLAGVIKSVSQGLVIFLASFLSYITALNSGGVEYARSIALSVIIISNLLLVFVNSSELDSAAHSITHLIRDKVMWATALGTLLLIFAALYTPLSRLLKLVSLDICSLLLAVLIALAAVLWYELVKLFKRRRAYGKGGAR